VSENAGIDLYFLHTRVLASWMPAASEPDISEYRTWFGMAPDLPRWDLREQIALDIRPFESTLLRDYVALSADHRRLTAMDLWFNGASAVPGLMQELDIEVISARQRSWIPVYQQWQQRQLPYIAFAWQISDILYAVVNNLPKQLPNLTLLQEAAIQHCLIYLHDVNLRNWQLDQFPNDARALHQLLCENHHAVDPHYRDLLRRSIDSLRSSMF